MTTRLIKLKRWLFISVLLLFVCSPGVYAQETRTLVLTNMSTQAIWIDNVRYGDLKLPAGYLPVRGRIYLVLGTQEVDQLLLRWHISSGGPLQHQTIPIDWSKTTVHKKSRFLILAFEGKRFIEIPNEKK